MVQLFKGDCLEIMDLLISKNIKVDAIITDPPYGTTSCKWDAVIPISPMWDKLKNIIKLDSNILIFASEPFASMVRVDNIKDFKYNIIWNKKLTGSPAVAKYRPLPIHEIIMLFNSGKAKYNPIMRKGKMRVKGRKTLGNTGSDVSESLKGLKNGHFTENDLYYPVDILDIPNTDRAGKVHPTQKPVILMEYLIKTYTNVGDVILDFTMGSGSTGVAAVNLGRDFIGIERDDKYFAIAEKRISEAEQNSLF